MHDKKDPMADSKKRPRLLDVTSNDRGAVPVLLSYFYLVYRLNGIEDYLIKPTIRLNIG